MPIWCEKFKVYKDHKCANCVETGCGIEPGVERVIRHNPSGGISGKGRVVWKDPEPEWDADKIIAMVREDLKQRSEFGLSKYGMPLSARHDIPLPGWLRHMYEELLDAANYAKCMMVYGVGYFRAIRQKSLYDHGKAGFGDEYFTPEQRAIRLMEEVCECIQAAGVSEEKALDLVAYSFNRPKGDVAIEIGQVGVTLCMLAESLGIDAEGEESAETARFLSRPITEMQARIAEKLRGGMPVAD
jgi:NTP pyrophosphatase (non-canonical NTP hydrolase)